MPFEAEVVRGLALAQVERSGLHDTLPWQQAAPPFEGLLALVVTDLEAFTTWVVKLGDVRARLWIREHNRLMREAIAAADGYEVAHTGDGMIAAFRSLHAALRCTQRIQRSLADYSLRQENAPLCARIGVHAGEPLPEEGRLFGSCVNTTVRVCARAQAGQTLVTDVVRQLAEGRGFAFCERGEAQLKGLPNERKLYELLAEDAPRRSTVPPLGRDMAVLGRVG